MRMTDTLSLFLQLSSLSPPFPFFLPPQTPFQRVGSMSVRESKGEFSGLDIPYVSNST